MNHKLVFINSDKKPECIELEQNTSQINTSDIVTEINNDISSLKYYIFNDIKLFLNTNIDNIVSQDTIFFSCKNCDDIVNGLSKKTNKSISALCPRMIEHKYLNNVANIHKIVSKDFCKSQYKSVCCLANSLLEDIDRIADMLSQFIYSLIENINKLEFFQLNLVLRELLTNAVKHGNRLDKSKHIVFVMFFNILERKLGFAVQDEGNGFDFKKHLKTIEKDELRINERGLFLINEFCNKIYSKNNLLIVELKS